MKSLWNAVVNNDIPKPGCEVCDNGYVKHQKEPIGYDVETCGCLVENESLKYTQKLLKQSGIDGRLIMHYKLEEWEEPKDSGLTFDVLLELISSDDVGHNWLFLNGDAGTGKTYAAIIAAQIALLKEKSVYFTGVTKLLENLRPKENEETNISPSLLLSHCYNVDVLILDDIGHEKSSQWVKERLYLIINERWNKGNITIFTSNHAIENLKSTVSPAVYSRVKGDSIEIQLEATKDRRL